MLHSLVNSLLKMNLYSGAYSSFSLGVLKRAVILPVPADPQLIPYSLVISFYYSRFYQSALAQFSLPNVMSTENRDSELAPKTTTLWTFYERNISDLEIIYTREQLFKTCWVPYVKVLLRDRNDTGTPFWQRFPKELDQFFKFIF